MKLTDKLSSLLLKKTPALIEPLEARIAPAINNWIGVVGGNWNVAGNWSDGVPTADDDVFINPAGTLTITVSDNGRVANTVTLAGDDHLAIVGGSLTVAAASTVNHLDFSGGTLVSNGLLTLTGASTASGNATFAGTFRNEGALAITGGIVHLDSAVLNNAGTITQTGTRLDFNGANSALNNLAGALYEVKAPGDGPLDRKSVV